MDIIMNTIIRTAMYGLMNYEEISTPEYKRCMAGLVDDFNGMVDYELTRVI